ncbi:hypothetical protein B0H03_10231 [Rathayibacter iranicus NCPPB 2253 = VKM Ac-1602]|uniref:Uncharacterized protein n=1 Tax=Rathayibacter iranicus NCPPB 2253 = VKM Ac-1602 TaxID=1328868 RepID=A0ABX5LI25_9MICO|nr:hypothetical protein B0H03_10231 [Rathayibacter iranicus NCPPB 2253 = VKM Ac-1602]
MSDQGKPAKRPLRLSVDWGQKWPLNDYIGPGPIVD